MNMWVMGQRLEVAAERLGDVPPRWLRPILALWRRSAYVVDGGDGCCRCGGPDHNWVYWGACGDGGGYPDRSQADWAQCDSCHEAHPMPELRSMRLTDAERAQHWRDFLTGQVW